MSEPPRRCAVCRHFHYGSDHRCAPLWRVWLDGDEAGAVHLHADSVTEAVETATLRLLEDHGETVVVVVAQPAGGVPVRMRVTTELVLCTRTERL